MFSKVLEVDDWKSLEFNRTLTAVTGLKASGEEYDRLVDRKLWEYTIGMQSIAHRGGVALGVGSGIEPPLYYLTNMCRYVLATDIEYPPELMLDPGLKAPPIKWDRRRLGLMIADGTNLSFPDESFDTAFSYSSIEHFRVPGKPAKEGAGAAIREIARVLKRGGAASITTELVVFGADKLPRLREKYRRRMNLFKRYVLLDDFFTPQELHTLIETASLAGLHISNPLDTDVDIRGEWSWWPDQTWPYTYARPRFAPEIMYTSVHMLFTKE